MIDTTHFKRTGGGKSVSNTEMYLNDDFPNCLKEVKAVQLYLSI